MVTPEGIVIVLGWSIDDFEGLIKEVDEATLLKTLEILEAPDVPGTETDEDVVRAWWAAGRIRKYISEQTKTKT